MPVGGEIAAYAHDNAKDEIVGPHRIEGRHIPGHARHKRSQQSRQAQTQNTARKAMSHRKGNRHVVRVLEATAMSQTRQNRKDDQSWRNGQAWKKQLGKGAISGVRSAAARVNIKVSPYPVVFSQMDMSARGEQGGPSYPLFSSREIRA